MKRTLSPHWVQNWSLLGLKPMHRALIRRCVNQTNVMRGDSATRPADIAWHTEDLLGDSDSTSHSMLHRAGILVVDRTSLLARLNKDRPSDPFLSAIHTPVEGQIRLLWSWSLRGKQELLWCTEMLFDGVIHDANNLRAWLSTCLQRGTCHQYQSNGLLKGIELPTFAQPSQQPSIRSSGFINPSLGSGYSSKSD